MLGLQSIVSSISLDNKQKNVLLATFYMFFINLGIHLLRPDRDSTGLENGIENLPFLFSITFSVILLMNLVLGKLKQFFSYKKIVLVQHGILIAGGVFFLLAYRFAVETRFTGMVFFIWVSIINLWSISFAWDIITDIFTRTQFLKQFGIIAFGGTAGCIAGYSISFLSGGYELLYLLLSFSVALLVVKKLLLQTKNKNTYVSEHVTPKSETNTGFLFSYGAMIFLYALIATVLYFQQAYLVYSSSGGTDVYKPLFAQLGLWINVLAIVLQLFFSSKIIRRAGPFFPLAIIPSVIIGGLLCFSINSSFTLITILMAFAKVASFSLVRPAREILLYSIQQSQKNKIKVFFDTALYRGGDVAGSWLFILLFHIGIGVNVIALLAIPICLLWLISIMQLRKYSLKVKEVYE